MQKLALAMAVLSVRTRCKVLSTYLNFCLKRTRASISQCTVSSSGTSSLFFYIYADFIKQV